MRRRLIGAAELVGALAVVAATFTVGGVADDPLPWRVLAAFMGAEGARRLWPAGE